MVLPLPCHNYARTHTFFCGIFISILCDTYLITCLQGWVFEWEQMPSDFKKKNPICFQLLQSPGWIWMKPDSSCDSPAGALLNHVYCHSLAPSCTVHSSSQGAEVGQENSEISRKSCTPVTRIYCCVDGMSNALLCFGSWLICQRIDSSLIGEGMSPLHVHASGGLLTDSLERQNCVCGSEWECNQISLDFRPWHTRPCPVIGMSCRGMTVSVDVGQNAPCLAPRPWHDAM